MSSFRIRPRFRQHVKDSFDDIKGRMKKGIEKNNNPYAVTYLPNQITLRILPEDRHFWSPQLNITLEEKDDGTLIRGTLWTKSINMGDVLLCIFCTGSNYFICRNGCIIPGKSRNGSTVMVGNTCMCRFDHNRIFDCPNGSKNWCQGNV